MKQINRRQIQDIEQALAYLDPSMLDEVVRALNALANSYRDEFERLYDPGKSLYELAALVQLQRVADLLQAVGSALALALLPQEESPEGESPGAEPHKENKTLRDKEINWQNPHSFREDNEVWNEIFVAHYERFSLHFATPVTDRRHAGSMKLVFKRRGKPARRVMILLTHDAVLDMQLGLALIGTRELRGPYTEIVLSGSENEGKGKEKGEAA